MANTDKIMSLREFTEWKSEFTGKVVATNGVFDLLHPGHMEYLEEASELGDALVIALNSDSSVKALKDPRRPIINEEDRAYMLASLDCVSKVVIFEDLEALNTLLEIKPHIYVKGGDYTIDTINQNERRALEERDIEIQILKFKAGFSTTLMIDKIIKAYG
ncbi:adenylyltransferase/cytidyltransferase family protein [Lentisphaera marina]|uniref:adenylyltransferase/cytidyltransferase family protein n=1 Tax=Lentisphaera marina TaxID=1111041 RepID=UPI00236536CB|nr:adenylyltransferase/cytidyltransferase family protein [Lentisphaera marina]MDD7987132.1 adenylyltransferase/cytidyltransferase family protein [Lentisphaera marina]